MKRSGLLIVIGVICMISLAGCGKTKYKLHLEGSGFESKKTEYAAGEKVTVYYDLIATDTDYYFSSDDVEFEQNYDERHGYVITFIMPDHDVTLSVKSRNSMMFIPYIEDPDSLDLENGYEMLFDYYESTIATVGGNEYEEMALYEWDEWKNEFLIMSKYTRKEDEEGHREVCVVPVYALEQCMSVVEKNKMSKWNSGIGIDGKLYVIRFMNDGELIRITSDDMPENGENAFFEIYGVLKSYWENYGPIK